MTKNEQLTELFESFRQQDSPPVLILESRAKLPVAAIYLDRMACEFLTVHQTQGWQHNGSQRYYLVVDGKIGVFFTYFRKSKRQ